MSCPSQTGEGMAVNAEERTEGNWKGNSMLGKRCRGFVARCTVVYADLRC